MKNENDNFFLPEFFEFEINWSVLLTGVTLVKHDDSDDADKDAVINMDVWMRLINRFIKFVVIIGFVFTVHRLHMIDYINHWVNN